MATASNIPEKLKGIDLKSLTYGKAGELVEPLSDQELMQLFDSSSIKLGDTAADYLVKRRKHQMIIDAVHSRTLKTRNGKVRAANVLKGHLLGGRCIDFSRTFDALMILAEDKNRDAVNTVLVGVVLWGGKSVLPKLRELYSKTGFEDYQKAIRAIEENDIRILSPHQMFSEEWKNTVRQHRPDENLLL
jgi:hypothetical protein